MMKNELSYKSLKNICNPNNFKFETTDDLDSKDLIYGQDRGIKALEFGLDVEAKGYNLYLEGPSGVGKTMYTKNYVTKIATKKKHLMIGAIYITLKSQMNLLPFLYQLAKVKNLGTI